MQPEILRSQNPFLSTSSGLRQTHQEQAGNFRQNCNQSELIKLLMTMRQEMKERDDQLKTQLQLKDEYFAEEHRIRDQNLEDALKKRDEEWRAEIEKSDIEWRTVLRERERENALKASMDSRDNNCMNSLGHYQ